MTIGGRQMVYIRVDCSPRIGSGHIMRCLGLARALRERSVEARFLSRAHPGGKNELLRREGFKLIELRAPPAEYIRDDSLRVYDSWLGVGWREDADECRQVLECEDAAEACLVVDHYALDARWEDCVRGGASVRGIQGILSIDDIAQRPHLADILVDPTYIGGFESRYDALVPAGTRKLLGPKYALLRPEFAALRNGMRPRGQQPKKILVFFGGADPADATSIALRALLRLQAPSLEVDVVIGSMNSRRSVIESLASRLECAIVHVDAPNMASLMLEADVSLGAGGLTTWERCCLGLPTLVLAVAQNQCEISRFLHSAGIHEYLGEASDVTEGRLAGAIQGFLSDAHKRELFSRASSELVDGLGMERIVSELLRLLRRGRE